MADRSEQLYRDGKRVLECLQRALRVADSCMETATSIELFVEILDRYVYYFDQKNESVSLSSPFAFAPFPPSPQVFPLPFCHTPPQLFNPLTQDPAGHNKVPQRPHRAHPLQPGRQQPAGLGLGRGQPQALFADPRDHQEQGVRGRCADAQVSQRMTEGDEQWR